MRNKETTLNGIKVYPFRTFEELLEYASERKGILVAVNAEKILHATERMRTLINKNIGYCDGIGAVLALKKHGVRNAAKLPGCELWLRIIHFFYHREKTFYLVGSRQKIIEETVARLRIEYPGIRIVNYRNGYLNCAREYEKLLDDLVSKKPDVVFVAMGSPGQEFLMEKMFERHPAIYQGLGGSFDVYAGFVKRAPRWWIEHNLEFAYRLLSQPSRIKRQIHLARFLWLVILGKI